MGKMPDALRETIARNIRECRMRKFPGRGGGKRCAEAFGVSPQQWSPWESGKRTPDELRLEQIAAFFTTTVEWFRRDHRGDTRYEELSPMGGLATSIPPRSDTAYIRTHVLEGDMARPRYGESSEEDDMNHYLWAIDVLTRKLTASGIRVVVTFEKTPAAAAQ